VELVEELTKWLQANWDPDLEVGEWWRRLGLEGWAAPSLPENAFGRGLSRGDTVVVQRTISSFGALPAPGGLGLLLAAPTIAAHGTQRQIDNYVKDIVTGQKAWCQLFSEPAAGSDLAGLQTRAERDGDEWVVNGQKVWTSSGHWADIGMLLARTNVDVPKHKGITYFALDMHQPGVEVRPLREMTGRAMFNEVFLTEARTTSDAIIGGIDNGWAVANTTLANERAGLGAGGGDAAASLALPGTVAGHLSMRAGDFVGKGTRKKSGEDTGGLFGVSVSSLAKIAKETGAWDDPTIRQDIARLYTLGEVGRYSNLRMKAMRASGGDIPGLPNMAKLSMSEMVRLSRDLGLRILGPYGMLHGYTNEQREQLAKITGRPVFGAITDAALFAQAPSIYGGTDQIQRNILGERVLGLPREPSNDREVPFRDLLKNR
jgi:alkylation response protein AidB-like acyl-CoA dehydrogenase